MAATHSLTDSPTNMPAPVQTGPRRPRGIYAVVDINSYIGSQQAANHSITPAELHATFTTHYNSLLANPAIAGLTMQIGWSRLNPHPLANPDAYDWSWLDDAFSSADAWNAQNPAQTPKTIQVQVFPGFFTPAWVLDQIPNCDGLFMSPPQTPSSDCGKATFVGFGEPHDNLNVLPLPWNVLYKAAWKTFLIALAARYEANPDFVSIDVAGPTAASTEIIEPTDTHTPQFGNISGHDMWLQLLAFAYPDKPAYQKSDQAFIDEWNAAIDMFEQVLSHVTLVVTHGSGLPQFSDTGFTVPAAFKDQCPVPPGMDCAAEATILAHFIDPSTGGSNAKAVQGSGLSGRTRPISNILKWLAQTTAQFKSSSAQILEGEQFGTGFSRGGIAFGCTSPFPPDKVAGNADPSTLPVADIPKACLAPDITQANLAGYKQVGDVPANNLIPPEQALYNILKNYFDGTPAAAYFGGTVGTVPQNYLQIYNTDVLYVTAHANSSAQVIQTDRHNVTTTAQNSLNLASQKIFAISEPDRSP